MERITAPAAWPLHTVACTRALESQALSGLAPLTLMLRAAESVARLALAVAPHAQDIWIACGPGNNGGDGLLAGLWLQQAGKRVHVSRWSDDKPPPVDAQQALQRVQQAGLVITTDIPKTWDLAIDALLGLGARTAPSGRMGDALAALCASPAPVVCVDVPTGLSADTGVWHGPAICPAQTRHTLSLMTLKPGLFTRAGRDGAGTVWLDTLGLAIPEQDACAWLQGPTPLPRRWHDAHKGRFGDVAVLGGDVGMSGAALLAGTAALHAGAGRVMVHLLAQSEGLASPAALMLRPADALSLGDNTTVVAGCGGGDAIRAHLPRLLSQAARLVLDADALNAVAQDQGLLHLLQQRAQRQLQTVLTPHPLEAARLLGTSTNEVQADRLASAQALATLTQSCVVLKGAGSVIARAQGLPHINPTGNARLSTAGSGDVLAGMMGARMAQGQSAWDAACGAVYAHGQRAEEGPQDSGLTADMLAC
jgi:hydroxyethylthiazole kinase-like uncharacterized protein yjeF